MRAQKTFIAPPPIVVSTTPAANETAESLVISLPESPISRRTIDLTPWLGHGIDEWVWASAMQLRAFLAGGKVQPSSVVAYWVAGFSHFFNFLIQSGGLCVPQALEAKHVRLYLGWIKDHDNWGYGSQKIIFSNTKSVLVGLRQRDVIPDHDDLFPGNPFPGSNAKMKGQTSLSPGERKRLAVALRDDLVAIHKDRFEGTESEVLVVHVLALAIRTGLNPTPLLEMQRDCLRPHPFMPAMMLLETFKRRGNATHLKSLRYSREEGRPTSIPMDGVALLKKVIDMTEPLVAEAQPTHKGRVWLYRSEKISERGKVAVLQTMRMQVCINSLVTRHDLRDDSGKPLRLNLSRLRKTLENRLWTLSGGDLIATAALMGHQPKVADMHYLACTQQMRENATFVGEALPNIYRSGSIGSGNVIPIHLDNTPVGRCKDVYNGDKAPQNGDPCDDFFSCFSCTSYAIVGAPEDLHRLFSFYWFLEREMAHARSNDWREQFRLTMVLIDAFTLDKFDAALVAAAKQKARTEPIKFWASYSLSEGTNG